MTLWSIVWHTYGTFDKQLRKGHQKALSLSTSLSETGRVSSAGFGKVCMFPQGQLSQSNKVFYRFSAWFLRPSQVRTEAYYEMSLPVSRLQQSMQSCPSSMGSCILPFYQGRLAKQGILWHPCAAHYTVHGHTAAGHLVSDCPFARIYAANLVQNTGWCPALFSLAQGPEGCLSDSESCDASHCLGANHNLAND